MPRDTFNDGELVTDDLGRLWLISCLRAGTGVLMPELPGFLSEQGEKKVSIEGFEFDQMADGIVAEREACAKTVESRFPEGDPLAGVWKRMAAEAIRSRK